MPANRWKCLPLKVYMVSMLQSHIFHNIGENLLCNQATLFFLVCLQLSAVVNLDMIGLDKKIKKTFCIYSLPFCFSNTEWKLLCDILCNYLLVYLFPSFLGKCSVVIIVSHFSWPFLFGNFCSLVFTTIVMLLFLSSICWNAAGN